MSKYRSITPVQQFDPTACWAASLEWFARAAGGGRQQRTQNDLIRDYVAYWDTRDPDTNPDYGTVSRANLITILSDPPWRMDVSTMPGADFSCRVANQKMRHGPIVMGYYDSVVGGNHVVVAYGASETHVAVMDPNGGAFHGRLVSYFQSAEVIIGSPRR